MLPIFGRLLSHRNKYADSKSYDINELSIKKYIGIAFVIEGDGSNLIMEAESYMSFRLSKYTLQVPADPPNGKTLLYNTLTRSIVQVNETSLNIIHNPERQQCLTSQEQDALQQLKQLGVLVNEEEDEFSGGCAWYQRIRNDRSVIHLTVLTTYSCNLACPYCVENGVKKRIFLKRNTSQQIVRWVKGILEEEKAANLLLTFYGGEPLLNKKEIYFLSDAANILCEHYALKKSCRLITNGVLLVPSEVDALVKEGVTHVKITLDGFGEDHDRKRPTLGGQGTFSTIIENLTYAVNHLQVTIGSNFDSSNLESVKKLYDYLHSLGLHQKLKAVHAKPILSTLSDKIASAISQQCTVCRMSETDYQGLLDIVKYAQTLGFNVADNMSLGPCQALKYHSYVIDPNGVIYKCPGFVGRPEFAIGDVAYGVMNTQKAYRDLNIHEPCQTCKYMPLCAGGCRHSAFLENDDDRGMACEGEYFERTAGEFVRILSSK